MRTLLRGIRKRGRRTRGKIDYVIRKIDLGSPALLRGMKMSVIHIFSKTDVGMKREQNEDSIRTIHVKEGGINGEMEYWALILADGMGGYDKGEVASAMTCQEFAKFSIEKIPGTLSQASCTEEVLSVFEAEVTEMLSELNRDVWELSEGGKMGSTLVFILVYDNNLFMAWVGDSRAYMISNREIEQITRDHSYVNALLENGAITEEEAEDHPMKNVITKSVGTNETLKAEFKQMEFPENSFVLLCSDGLTDMVNDDGIGKIVLNNTPPQICQKLIDAANEAGGKDNISIILARSTPGRTARPIMKPVRSASTAEC